MCLYKIWFVGSSPLCEIAHSGQTNNFPSWIRTTRTYHCCDFYASLIELNCIHVNVSHLTWGAGINFPWHSVLLAFTNARIQDCWYNHNLIQAFPLLGYFTWEWQHVCQSVIIEWRRTCLFMIWVSGRLYHDVVLYALELCINHNIICILKTRTNLGFGDIWYEQIKQLPINSFKVRLKHVDYLFSNA